MCRGVEREGNDGVFPSQQRAEMVSCELCGSRASLYCQADDAFLCRKCDKWVHQANFLALRHVRCLLCSSCQKLTQRYLVGASREVVLPTVVGWPETTRQPGQCDNIEVDNEDDQSTTKIYFRAGSM
ncbi:B-box domain protein 30 [Carica papaya]|uniref:B-box domain protein 30 n=1 Tax=Carica papaya TaxID=3649 RepID=UPI000B8D0CE0|nr:B-box domain protein 30 [Carica papaya]